MARTSCPVCGPRWPGQNVQFVGRDGPDKMSSLWAEMARTRCPVCGPRWPRQDVQLWAEMARTRCPIGEPRWLGQDVHFLSGIPSTNTTMGCAGCFKCLTAGINVCPGSLALLDGFLTKSLMDLSDFLDLDSHQGQPWRSRGHPEQPGLSTRSTESDFQADSSPSATRPFLHRSRPGAVHG